MVRSAARFLLVLLIRFSIRNSAQRARYLFNTNISKYLTKVFVIHDLELYRFSIFLNFEVVLVTLTPTMTEDEAVSKKKSYFRSNVQSNWYLYYQFFGGDDRVSVI